MNRTIFAIVIIVAAVGIAGIVNAIGSSTPVHAQATVNKGSNFGCKFVQVITPSGHAMLTQHCS